MADITINSEGNDRRDLEPGGFDGTALNLYLEGSMIVDVGGLNGKIGYNPTIPFLCEGKEYIGVRVEPLDDGNSNISFAYRTKGPKGYRLDHSIPSIPGQDPRMKTIDYRFFLTTVDVESKGRWRNKFYAGANIACLEEIAFTPWGMKDTEVFELEGGGIGIFTRPRGGKYREGMVGYFKIDSIEDLGRLTKSDWYSARLLKGLFGEGKFGGVNQATSLSSSEIAVIGHEARKEIVGGNLIQHYHATSFIYNPKTGVYSVPKKIAGSEDFPKSNSKRSPELDDVFYPAGISISDNLKLNPSAVVLHGGLRDRYIVKREILNPFFKPS